MAVVDWHKLIRDQVAVLVAAAYAAEGVAINVMADSSLDTGLIDLPGIIATYADAEQLEGQYGGGTNLRFDMNFAIMLGFFTMKPDDGGDAPGNNPTYFHALIRDLFHMRRTIVLATPGLSFFPTTIQIVPIINNENRPAIENLQSAMVVNVPVRLPRGTI